MSSLTHSVYSPLAEGSIRLLTILNGGHGKVICELQEFTLDEVPEYTALSYSWGKPETSETITCNDKPFLVTPHLLGALHHIYSFIPRSKVWIDAICINQQDDAEKSIHTRGMGSVYRSAQTVLVWLGKADNESDLALDTIESLNEKLAPILQDDTPERAAHLNGWFENNELTSSGLPSTDDPIWRALGHIYSRTWFNRLWVLQEVALAKQIVVGHGSKQVTWDALVTLATGLRRAVLLRLIAGTANMEKTIRNTLSAINLANIARGTQQVGVFGILSLLAIGRYRDVTEPVDKIYGMLGMIDPKVANQIVVDYSAESREKWWKAYIQYSKFQFQAEGTLMLLSMAASQYKPDELPSWCPNFNSPRKDLFSLGGVIGYQAGYESMEERIKPRIRTSPDSNIIEFLGFRIDRVRHIAGSPKHCFEIQSQTMEGPSGIAALLLEYEARCLKLSQEAYHSPDAIPEAHWRTLTADSDFFSKAPLKPDVFDDYLRAKEQWILRRDQTSPDFIDSRSNAERQRNLNFFQTIEQRSSRTFFSTYGGRVGLGPSDLQPEDVICVLYGGSPLYVLRFDGADKVARFVGDAFVYGLMDLKSIPKEDRGEDEFFAVS